MRALLAAAGVLVLLAASAHAGCTVLRARPDASALRGIRRAPAFDVDAAGLAQLRAGASARLDAFPVGALRRAIDLERFDPLAGARIEVVGPTGSRMLPRPDLAFFRGRVEGDPGSLAIVTAGPASLRALVLGGDGVTVVGPDAAGTHRAWALADVDPDVWPPPAAFCMNDLADLTRPAALAAALSASPPPTGTTHLGLRRAEIALETDQELRAKFGSDEAALAYVASVFAEASAVYERDLEIALDLSYVRIWSTTDPWSASDPEGQLAELRGYWNNPANGMAATAGPRDAVHMMSGKPVLGGIAYIDAVCNGSYGYGVSQVYGEFDASNPSDVWDLVVVMHELGHNFGSEHTHCYSPPIDTCYSGEPGCYVGPESTSQGTLMSYCHLRPGGLSNLDLRFHDRVRDLLHATTAAHTCLAPDGSSTCGNGALDDGEECDDGNRSAGDGCSGGCRIEACGNGILDVGEGCDDGNEIGGDGCSAICTPERCGDGERTGDEECDDGNTVEGDGCSSTCRVERCALLLPHQRVWSSARLIVKPAGAKPNALVFRAVFEIPANAVLDAAETGLLLLGEAAGGGTSFEIALPGGAGWTTRGSRLRYRDPAALISGVKKATVVAKARGSRARVKIIVVGKGGDYPETLAEMPTRLVVVLGDEAAGESGACGEWEPTLGACRSERGGKRLACR